MSYLQRILGSDGFKEINKAKPTDFSLALAATERAGAQIVK